ncbi:MAG: hypothetical protein GX376_00650 [Firmicutes bacterium]|nr:hypothetical protein [Bacillota bacterium]
MEQVVLIITATLAGVAAYVISVELGKGAVLGSAIVVLAGGIIFPPLLGDLGSSMALVAATAAYAGMVSKDNIRCRGEMAVVGCISGFLFLAAAPAYPGVGGRLGTIGAIACLSFMGYRHLFGSMGRQNMRNVPTGQRDVNIKR